MCCGKVWVIPHCCCYTCVVFSCCYMPLLCDTTWTCGNNCWVSQGGSTYIYGEGDVDLPPVGVLPVREVDPGALDGGHPDGRRAGGSERVDRWTGARWPRALAGGLAARRLRSKDALRRSLSRPDGER